MPSWFDRKSEATKHRAKGPVQAGFALGIKDRRSGESAKSDNWLLYESRRRFPNLPPYRESEFRQGYNRGFFEKLHGGKGQLPNPPVKRFRTLAAAKKYARERGMKITSIRKLK
jgi:hypothetical protein